MLLRNRNEQVRKETTEPSSNQGFRSVGIQFKDSVGDTGIEVSIQREHHVTSLVLKLSDSEYKFVDPGKGEELSKNISKFLQPLPYPFFKLKPGIITKYFGKDSDAYKAVEALYARQDVLLHDYRRRYANMCVLAALVGNYIIPLLGQDSSEQMFQFILLVSVSTIGLKMIFEKTPIGNLEYIYNNKTRQIRASLDTYIGETASAYVPHLDSIARFAGAYIASSMLADAPLIKCAIALECALKPAYSKYSHDKPYIEHGL
ncbi:MAG: hypothetical protein ACK5V4_03610 [Alphaproteobacteria bacterium]